MELEIHLGSNGMRFIFLDAQNKFSLVEGCIWGTADDHIACGIEDLHAHAPEGGHAVHAVNVESSGAAGDVEAIESRGNINGGDNLNCFALAIKRD